MSTEDNIAIAAVRREFTDALAEVLAENAAVCPVRRGRVARAHAAIKGTRVTTNMNFVRRSSSPLSSGRLYKTPVRRRRLSLAHKSRRSSKRIAANVAKLPEGSNPALGLNASQPQKQNCADNNNKQNNQLHGSCSRLPAKIPVPHKGPIPPASFLTVPSLAPLPIAGACSPQERWCRQP